MLIPKEIRNDLKAHHNEMLKTFNQNSWIIPIITLLHIIPLAIGIHGFWKSRALNKQLKIEREKTKQLALEHVTTVETETTDHHCKFPCLPRFMHQAHNED
ncbi:hypothetical protein [Lactiplantibacillus herbarum]|uniref:hypothetical protein n=1 Tax=Lactiplantibacillus herbarum TaxID=1670446 RepID=UPI00064F85F3|nr:hypothetical protein [Lactiplantibacillus herbarum]